MGKRANSFARSQIHNVSVILLGTGNPSGTIRATKIGAFFWDSASGKLYIAEATGKNNWVLASTTGTVSPSSSEIIDELTTTIDDQTSFTLSQIPATASKVKLWVNGAKMTYGTHYTVSGTTLTFIPGAAGFDLKTVNEFGVPDKLIAEFFV